MDQKELQCTTPGSNKVFIPIRANGQVPALGANLVATIMGVCGYEEVSVLTGDQLPATTIHGESHQKNP